MSRPHLGKEDLKSGKEVTPGQSSSVGVPRRLWGVSQVLHVVGDGDVPEDLEDLVDFRVTGEQGLSRAHFSKYAADGPHIDTGRVLPTTKQNLRGAVPQRNDLVGVGAEGHTKGSRESEISKLEVSVAVDKEILGLQITVQHAVAVAVTDALAQLAHELLYHRVAETETAESGAGALGERLAASAVADGKGFHVFLQVEVEELHNEVELVAVGVHNVEEADDVGVVHLFQEGDLADGGGGDSFIFGFETDFLEGYNAATVQEVAGFVDDSVGSWKEWSQPLLQVGGRAGQHWGLGNANYIPSPIFSNFW